MQSVVSKVNPSLTEERSRCTFPVEQLTFLLDGGNFNTEKRREVEKLVLDDPAFVHPPVEFMPRNEQYNIGVKKSLLCQQRLKEYDLQDDPYASFYFRRVAMPREASPIGLHWVMFVPTLMGQSSEAQKDKWMNQALNYQIIGTYAQTEMGHGTFLRGIETTATYDVATQEFVLHSPTVTSIKMWPGSLGKTANHAIVVAQLHTLGENHGIHLFMLQLRDYNTHKTLPGITLGDIGPKMGYHSNDNGFLQLNNVRIPRENMLMKNSEVLADGRYVSHSTSKKLTYGTMVFVRSLIIADMARGASEAATIAIRYASIRRQGEASEENAPEPKLIDYPLHQYRLFSALATTYALWFASEVLRELYFQVQPEIMEGNVERLPETHALSAGLKALGSDQGVAAVEECRRCCGGFGYSLASGLPKIYHDILPACTYEGENNVMYLQTARHLLKCLERSKKGQSLAPSDAYITHRPLLSVVKLDPVLSTACLVRLLQVRSLALLQDAGSKFHSEMEKLQFNFNDAFQSTSRRLKSAAMAHCVVYVAQVFHDVIEGQEDEHLRSVLTSLMKLYVLNEIVSHSGEFILIGCLTKVDLARCQDTIEHLLVEIRPNAVSLVDAFDLPDRLLNSVIGCYDGCVYDRVLQWSKQSPLNATDVHESYDKYLKKFMRGESLAPKL